MSLINDTIKRQQETTETYFNETKPWAVIARDASASDPKSYIPQSQGEDKEKVVDKTTTLILSELRGAIQQLEYTLSVQSERVNQSLDILNKPENMMSVTLYSQSHQEEMFESIKPLTREWINLSSHKQRTISASRDAREIAITVMKYIYPIHVARCSDDKITNEETIVLNNTIRMLLQIAVEGYTKTSGYNI